MKHDSYYYQSNIDRLVSNAERRVEALKIQREIFAIDTKLRLLEELYPPQNAAVEEPSAVHSAPLP
jgi:hypothetical protein